MAWREAGSTALHSHNALCSRCTDEQATGDAHVGEVAVAARRGRPWAHRLAGTWRSPLTCASPLSSPNVDRAKTKAVRDFKGRLVFLEPTDGIALRMHVVELPRVICTAYAQGKAFRQTGGEFRARRSLTRLGCSPDLRQVLVQRYLSEQYTERVAGEHADADDDADAAVDVGAARPGRGQRAAPVLDCPTGGGVGDTSTAAFALEAYVCLLRAGFVADRASTVGAWAASVALTSPG